MHRITPLKDALFKLAAATFQFPIHVSLANELTGQWPGPLEGALPTVRLIAIHGTL